MTLEKLFPDRSVHRTSMPSLPESWARMLSPNGRDTIQLLIKKIGLHTGSAVATRMLEPIEIGLLIPKRKRFEKLTRAWKLAILYSPDQALVIGFPDRSLLQPSRPIPDFYLELVSQFGVLAVSQYSGSLVWPAAMDAVAHRLGVEYESDITPFYGYGTGDYDCWRRGEFDSIWQFGHETGQLVQAPGNAFPDWFGRLFFEAYLG